jgi:hypothetical protein
MGLLNSQLVQRPTMARLPTYTSRCFLFADAATCCCCTFWFCDSHCAARSCRCD